MSSIVIYWKPNSSNPNKNMRYPFHRMKSAAKDNGFAHKVCMTIIVS